MPDKNHISRHLELSVEITPAECGQFFARFDDTEQAEFFNAVAKIVEEEYTPKGIMEFQLQAVSDNELLSSEGRKIMQAIGEYATEPLDKPKQIM